MKNSAIILLLIPMLMGCNKDKEEQISQEIMEPEKVGFDYFLNTNEKWYYSRGRNSGAKFTTEYTALRDTTIEYEGENVKAMILRENFFIQYTGGNEYEKTRDLIFHYDADKRELIGYIGNTSRQGLGNFLFLSYKTGCDYPILITDTIKAGNNYYTRFINVLNQEIIEGITLGFYECQIFPPQALYVPYSEIDEFKYTSDEFTYEWKKP